MNKPPRIDPLADKILALLACREEAAEIVLGGYFALQLYADYRRTHDIGAWWRTRADPAVEQAIRAVMGQVAADEDLVTRERKFGETASFELAGGTGKVFSFQIAVRSVVLEEPIPSAWPPILIETLSDNLASKMNALVDRGAPRDITDVKQSVDRGLITTADLWNLWRRKNPGESLEPARQKVLFHLTSLEGRRLLASIRDDAERERAQSTREWFKQEFLE